MMQEIQEENRKLQVSGYEWDITLTEQDVEEHGWIRGDSLCMHLKRSHRLM